MMPNLREPEVKEGKSREVVERTSVTPDYKTHSLASALWGRHRALHTASPHGHRGRSAINSTTRTVWDIAGRWTVLWALTFRLRVLSTGIHWMRRL